MDYIQEHHACRQQLDVCPDPTTAVSSNSDFACPAIILPRAPFLYIHLLRELFEPEEKADKGSGPDSSHSAVGSYSLRYHWCFSIMHCKCGGSVSSWEGFLLTAKAFITRLLQAARISYYELFRFCFLQFRALACNENTLQWSSNAIQDPQNWHIFW